LDSSAITTKWALNTRGVGKIPEFQPITRNISKTVPDIVYT